MEELAQVALHFELQLLRLIDPGAGGGGDGERAPADEPTQRLVADLAPTGRGRHPAERRRGVGWRLEATVAAVRSPGRVRRAPPRTAGQRS
jgi:hypothetical protein